MPQLEELKLSEEQAEAIIEKGIEYGAYSDEMPDSKKEKQAAADEIVSFSIDAYVNDGITSDDEDPAVAESGAQIEEILEMAGVEIEDGEPIFNDPPEAGEAEDEDDDNGDDEAEDDDEAPFNPDDYIEGYSELSVVSKLKAIKGLDPDDDEEAGLMEDIADWENAQDKPSSRVLNFIDDALGEEEGEEGDDEAAAEAEAEEEEAEGDEEEAEEEEAEDEPWEGYDKATAKQIKEILRAAADDEDEPLSREQVEYVLEYEQNREKPPPRKRVIDFCTALLEEIDNGGDEEEPEEEPEEEAPKRGRGRGRGRGRSRGKGEQSEGKPASAPSNGTVTITREQIVAALTDGSVEIEL